MKNLIRKILREVEEEQRTQQSPYHGSREDRLKFVLKHMQTVQGWDSFLQQIEQYKRIPSSFVTQRKSLLDILKYLGVRQDTGRYADETEMTYWFSKVFMINGGYDRDFTQGPIQLINLPVYDMSIDYTEEVFEYRTGWGTIVGAIDEKEAKEYFEGDPGNYIDDSDTHDTDYGDITDADNVAVDATRMLTFKPEWVGL